MAAPNLDVCAPYATEADLCDPCGSGPGGYNLDADLIADQLLIASNLLFRRTGRQFPGTCTETVRPCVRSVGEVVYKRMPAGTEELGVPRVVCRCGSARSCGCSSISEVTLGGFPITAVSEVKVRETKGADVLTLTAGTDYRVDDWRYLVRLPDADGTANFWPCGQVITADEADGEVFFEVTFSYGSEPPAELVHAAAVLACEMYLACQPDTEGKCRLPRKAQQVIRQGTTVILSDPTAIDVIDSLPEVRAAVQAHNPAGLQRRAHILSPDIGRPVRRVNT